MTPLPPNIETLSRPVRELWKRMNPCVLCPRECNIYRSKGETGFCGVADNPLVSSVGPHFGEESVLVGRGGSGTIFFAGCNLACIFCQNSEISHHRCGQPETVNQLVKFMLDLVSYGCSNINLVTPTHVAAPAAAAIELARKEGLDLPIVYNSGGYDSVETLKLLEGFIDIYMPDMKYSDGKIAGQLSNADDYPRINRDAIKQMHRQVGNLEIKNGLVTKGLLIRHLVLPNELAGSFEIIDFLAQEISAKTAINVMAQYHPCYKAPSNRLLNRRPEPEKIESVRKYAAQKGLRLIP